MGVVHMLWVGTTPSVLGILGLGGLWELYRCLEWKPSAFPKWKVAMETSWLTLGNVLEWGPPPVPKIKGYSVLWRPLSIWWCLEVRELYSCSRYFSMWNLNWRTVRNIFSCSIHGEMMEHSLYMTLSEYKTCHWNPIKYINYKAKIHREHFLL